jgi:type I restriction enzyme M protein
VIALSGRVRQSGVRPDDLNELEIPLPPLATQQAIVAEIEAEQKIVNENKKLIEIFEKKISDTISALWA